MILASSGPPGGPLGGLLGRVGPSWRLLGQTWRYLGLSWAVLDHLGRTWRPSWTILEAISSRRGHLGGHLEPSWRICWGPWQSSRDPAGRAEAPGGVLLEKEPKPKPRGFSTPGTPAMNRQGTADPRRLRRITAAPCPFGSAAVADSWARAWPS